jgi:hypothetical protein
VNLASCVFYPCFVLYVLGVSPTVNMMSCLIPGVSAIERSSYHENQLDNHRDDEQQHVGVTSPLSDSSPTDGSTTALLVNETTAALHGRASGNPARRDRASWMNDRSSVSEATTETLLLSPSENGDDDDGAESDALLLQLSPPTPAPAPPAPPKANNVQMAKQNAVLQPHQGRNPMTERNMHKRSDEELAVSGNNVLHPGQSHASVYPGQSHASDTVQSGPAHVHTTADNLFDSLADNLETSLVQNDVLSQSHHRNPPIPYVQNPVHVEPVAVRPKMANIPGNGNSNAGSAGSSSVPYNKLTVNEAKSQKVRFGKVKKPKDFASKLTQLGLFAKNTLSKSNQNILPSKLQDDRHGKNVHHRCSSEGSAIVDQAEGQTRGQGHTADAAGSRIQLEVNLQNGVAVSRPTNLQMAAAATSESHAAGYHGNRAPVNVQPKYPEPRLALAEVGVAKLLPGHKGHRGHPSILKIMRRRGRSKSTPDLSPEHRAAGEISRGLAEDDFILRRPNSLSLKGHNYTTQMAYMKPVSSFSLTVLAHNTNVNVNIDTNTANINNVKSNITLPLQDVIVVAPAEKIKRRVKTPLSVKGGRFSLYDDRLMSQSCDRMAKELDANADSDRKLKKSSISLHQLKGLDGNANSLITADHNC